MRKIVFLVPYPHNTAPSQRFRFEQYLGSLEMNGMNYSIQSFLDAQTWSGFYHRGNYLGRAFGIIKGLARRFLGLRQVLLADIVFVHREICPIGPPFFEWIIARLMKKKMIYDFDDAIWLKDPTESGILELIKWKAKTGRICKWSFRVSCGNDYLASYARQFNTNVIVNPTTIDTEKMHNPAIHYKKQKKERLTIGWTGTHTTLPYLEYLVPVIKQLEEKYDFTFLVIANRKPSFSLKSLEFLKWSESTEIEDLLKINIGVMPLTNDPWSMGKCGFKALQFMALEIPVCISPVGVNNEIVEHGINGYLCDQPDDWERRLSDLIERPSLREELGINGRKTIIDRFSVDSNRDRFIQLFSSKLSGIL